MIDPQRRDLVVGVLGAGTMGRGIAQVAAAAGMPVRLFDADPRQLDDAVAFIGRMFNRAAEKGRMSAEEAGAAIDRIRIAGGLNGFSDCHLVIEAIVEDLDIKQRTFAELDRVVGGEGILATNTSSLPVTGIAARAEHQHRIAGLHFFNPPPLMKLVEVIAGLRTDRAVAEALLTIARRMGKYPVLCQDTPGFLVNHAGRAYAPEALRIVSEGICEPVDVDRVMKDAVGFRMGPFELLDLVGIDVAHSVMEAIYHQYYEEPMYKPSVIGEQRKAGGLHGRKTGAGFYRYRDGGPMLPEEAAAPGVDNPRVWISSSDEASRNMLTAIMEAAGADVQTGEGRSRDATCVVTPLGADASTCAVAESLDPTRTVAVDTLSGCKGRRTIMTTPVTDPGHRDAVHALLAADGTPVTVIRDSPGFIAQRIVAMIVNVSCNIAQQRIAAPDDIDTAVKLGLNYPKGPLELGDEVGPKRVLHILRRLSRCYGDPRYRPSPWLVRRADLGLSLLTPES